MLKPVIQNPSPVLHKKAEKVSDFKNQKLHKIIKQPTRLSVAMIRNIGSDRINKIVKVVKERIKHQSALF